MENYPVSKLTHFCNISPNACSRMIEHKIDFYDLTFVLSGSMTYIADGETIVMTKNDAIFLPPGTVCSRLKGTCPVHYVSFNFLPTPHYKPDFDKFLPNSISANIKQLLKAFPQSHISPYYHSIQKATNMLNYILFELTDTVAMNSCNEHIIKITNYIEANLTHKLTLEDVSKAANLTKEYTAFLFKKETGKTVTAYINERKMLLARELIDSGKMTLADIALHLSFENYNYFSRLFKKHFDVTAVYYKNKVKN